MATEKKPLSKTARIQLVREAKKLVGTMNKTNMANAIRALKADVTLVDARSIVNEAVTAVQSKTTKK